MNKERIRQKLLSIATGLVVEEARRKRFLKKVIEEHPGHFFPITADLVDEERTKVLFSTVPNAYHYSVELDPKLPEYKSIAGFDVILTLTPESGWTEVTSISVSLNKHNPAGGEVPSAL